MNQTQENKVASALSPVILLAAIVALLPIANGLLFRSYAFPLHPAGLNPLFELEAIYLLTEIGIILRARAKGMAFKPEFLKLHRWTRYALLAFLAVFWISSLAFAPSPIYSAIRASYWLIHIGCAFAMAYLMASADREQVGKAITAIALAFVALSVLVMVHLLLAPFPLSERPIEVTWSALIPGFLSIRQFGMLSGFALAAWLGLVLSEAKMPLGRVASFAVTALIFAVMFWSGTRSALLGVLVAIPVVLLFARKLPSFSAAILAGAAASVGAYLSTLLLPADGAFGMFAQARFATGEGSDFGSGRYDLWKFGVEKFAQSPILGWGEGSFYQLFAIARQDYHLQPHNFVIQFLMSWGILAGGMALVMMAKALLRLHLGLHRAHLMTAPLAALDCILVMAMLDGALFTLRTITPAIFFWILAEKISNDAINKTFSPEPVEGRQAG